MYQEIIALQSDDSLRKKPRLSISEMAFHSEKSKIPKTTFKPELKRKFSQINLKDVLLSELTSDNPTINLKNNLQVDPEQQNQQKNVKRSRSNSKHLHEQINQNFIVKHLENQANNMAQRSVNKSRQKNSGDSFLPSIFKNSINDQKGNQIKYQKSDESRKSDEQKRYVSLELQGVMPTPTKQTNIAFKKLRSESLIYLQNKLKLQRAKLTDKNQEKEQKNNSEKQYDLPRSNTQKVNPTFTKEPSPDKKEKKFYINNLSLQTPQNHNDGLQKRNYILKFLQKHEKQLLPKQQNRKNTYFNVVEKDKPNDKPNPKNFYSSENLISKKIVFANPDEMLLKKLELTGGKTEKDKMNVKYQSQTSKKPKEPKIKKECINGWDFQNEYEELIKANDDQFNIVI